jgi:hypothetical protein
MVALRQCVVSELRHDTRDELHGGTTGSTNSPLPPENKLLSWKRSLYTRHIVVSVSFHRRAALGLPFHNHRRAIYPDIGGRLL